jgi:hypothetical protein
VRGGLIRSSRVGRSPHEVLRSFPDGGRGRDGAAVEGTIPLRFAALLLALTVTAEAAAVVNVWFEVEARLPDESLDMMR